MRVVEDDHIVSQRVLGHSTLLPTAASKPKRRQSNAGYGGTAKKPTMTISNNVSEMHIGSEPFLPKYTVPEFDPSKYKHLLNDPKKNVESTDRVLAGLLAQRRSKIGFSIGGGSSEGTLKFDRQTQTLLTGADGGRPQARVRLTHQGVQCERTVGDDAYLHKQYGRHIFDFGQSVDELLLERAQEVLRIEEKNRKLLFAETTPSAVRQESPPPVSLT